MRHVLRSNANRAIRIYWGLYINLNRVALNLDPMHNIERKTYHQISEGSVEKSGATLYEGYI